MSHAARVYHCTCGKAVRGNGGRAGHFYDSIGFERIGHRLLTNEQVHALTTLQPVERRALRDLKPGKHGTEQPQRVRSRLEWFQKRGFIKYDAAAGWSLTPLGVKACES
jgi:N-acetylglutamate synthase-like GNAT family acetyltransferase